MKAIFEVRHDSPYDDSIERYHLPSQYLKTAEAAVGDWVVIREPRGDGGANAYIAVARVTAVVPDSHTPRHHYAHLADYLRFDRMVPMFEAGRYWEAPLRAIPRTDVGRSLRGRSVRPLDDADFVAIVSAGLAQVLDPANARRLDLERGGLDPQTASLLDAPVDERRIAQVLLNRKVRDAAFRQVVLDAYDSTCAVTGLRIINGGGRAEAQAAHIMPVEHGGPDIVQNGIALSATVHWLFDRHLISIGDDGRLLVSHNRVPAELRQLFRPDH